MEKRVSASDSEVAKSNTPVVKTFTTYQERKKLKIEAERVLREAVEQLPHNFSKKELEQFIKTAADVIVDPFVIQDDVIFLTRVDSDGLILEVEKKVVLITFRGSHVPKNEEIKELFRVLKLKRLSTKEFRAAADDLPDLYLLGYGIQIHGSKKIPFATSTAQNGEISYIDYFGPIPAGITVIGKPRKK